MFLCLFYYCFYLLVSEDLTVFKKVYELYDKDILLVIFPRGFLYKFMTWWFHLLHIPLRFLFNILVLILAVVFSIVSFSMVWCFCVRLVFLFLIIWFHLVCIFLTILRKGKKHSVV